jgi:ankyrin repeat protein
MAGAFAVLILPFPVLGLVLFLLGRSPGLKVAAAVVAAGPFLALLALTGLKGISDWRRGASRSPRAVFGEPGPRAMAEAIEKGWMERVRFLLSSGVDVNAAGKEGETLVGFALRRRQVDAALELARRGADPTRGPAGEPNALRLAAQDPAFVEVLRAFLEAGTSPDTILPDDIDRPTPLLFTAMNTNALPNIRVVVEGGARLDVLDVNGRTPLARAIVWRMWDEARLMVERGAPVGPGQAGLANLETTLAGVVPPEEGTPEHEAWTRLLAVLADRGVPSPGSTR